MKRASFIDLMVISGGGVPFKCPEIFHQENMCRK